MNRSEDDAARCQVHGYPPYVSREPQSQDVAPSGETCPAGGATPPGATSCDSELAAITERLEIDAASYAGHTRDCPGFADRNTLLRMVEELTWKVELYRSARKTMMEAWQTSEGALSLVTKERDELRKQMDELTAENETR